MFFLAGDNDLSDLIPSKMSGLERVTSKKSAGVLAQFDGRDGEAIQIHVNEIENEAPVGLGELNGGDIETLIAFAERARVKAPSQCRALVIWSHGTSVDPVESSARAQISRFRTPLRSLAKRANQAIVPPILRGTLFPTTTLRRLVTRKIGPDHTITADFTGPDKTSSDYLSNLELKDALARIDKQQRVNILGLEACLMNTIEVAYQFRGLVTCFLASQSSIPRKGWIYEAVLSSFQDVAASDEEVAASVVRAARYMKPSDERNVTLSALRMGKPIEAVEKAISKLADAMTTALEDPRQRDRIALAHHRAQAFAESETIDLVDFCRQLQKLVTASQIVVAAQEVETQVESLVLENVAHGISVARAHGVSISFPKRNYISPTYSDLDFAKKSSWVKFLSAYYDKVYPLAGQTQPQPPPSGTGARESRRNTPH
ncbi:MAG TPA: clostripain-related cysteine peptidase [Thermoanaerobaculia bacterium]|nr:clostripain-related cysteine peptidase [Thermoanaerobaculia bacterium]